MLRGFKSAMMSSVFRGPENEGGADADAGNDIADVGSGADSDVGGDTDGGAPDPDGGAPDDDGSQKPLSVREQLKKSIAEVNAEADKAAKPQKEAKQAKPQKEAKPAVPAAEKPPVTDGINPPASLAKELHAEWANAPKAIKEAFLKREQDMQRGVDELKQRYTQIDKALEPHTDALRQMNATPAEAVDRMFLWFKALANSPDKSFPALAQSLGFDWGRLNQVIAGAGQQQQQDPNQQQGQDQQVVPEPVKNYIGQLEQRIAQLDGRFNSIQTDIQQSNFNKTQENLNLWSSDKEFFQEVRQDMAQLIQAGLIPLKENGQVDLDTAYERAIHFNPNVRSKVLAKQQQANQQVQQQATEAATTARQQQTSKARRAASSLPVASAPGQTPAQSNKKPGSRLSVRESLKAAVAELRDN